MMGKYSSNKFAKGVCFLVVLLGLAQLAVSKPPDNAALYYYQSFLMFTMPEGEMDKMFSDFRDGKIEINDEIEKFITKNRESINYGIIAAQRPYCDWGYDLSQGVSLFMPNLGKLRFLFECVHRTT